MKNVLCLFVTAMTITLCLSGCTYNISMLHNQGTSNDAIDTTTKADPVVSPQFTLPIAP